MTLAIPPTSLPATPDDRGCGGLLGLLHGREVAFPLTRVRVRATITGRLARTEIEQHFQNPHPQPLEVVHLFPLPPDGAVVEAELRCGELSVKAECREKQEAEATFAAARSAGHRALLLTAERPDLHTLRVTNLPPGAQVVVRLVVVEVLDVVDGLVRFRFPTTIAPRYLPGTPIGHAGPGTAPDTDRAPDASRLSPPLRLAGGTTLDLEVHVLGRPRRVQSSLHAVRLDLEDGVRVAPSGTATLDRDFVLAVGLEPGPRAWTDGTHTLVHLAAPALAARALPRDAVFVVDISGSMEGEKLDAARTALKAALHGMLPGDRFRLLAFDDRIEAFRPGFVAYDERSLAAADQWVDRLRARGGTEMLPAVVAALEGERATDRVTTVLFVTDGQVHDDGQLVAAVAGRARGARFFTLGIDTAVNAGLLERLARVGGGTCTLATPADDLDAVMSGVEARFGSPLLTEVRVDGPAANPDPMVLFDGHCEAALLEGAATEVSVRGTSASGPWSERLPVTRIADPLGAAWARARVSWLEDRLVLRPFEEEAIRPEIVRIATAAGIASRFTAFVAVERSLVVTGERQEVVQPHQLPAGWNEGFAAPLAAPPQGAFGGAPTGAPAPRAQRARVGQILPSMVADFARPSDKEAAESALPPAPSRPAPAAAKARRFDAAKRALASLFESGPADLDDHDGAKEEATRPTADPASRLATSQAADGSWGGDLRRTLAAIVALALLGHGAHTGLRKRAVRKALGWLDGQPPGALVDRVRALVDAVDGGKPAERSWGELVDAGPEGAVLGQVLAGR